MLELTGFGSVLRGIGILYWVLAIGAVGLAIWKGKTWQRKTLWAGIGDALCGFRVYPAAPLRDIMERRHWMRRFDFDPEAATRLCWRGLNPINIAAPVRYFRPGEGGVSHFNYLRDNAMLAWMHLRLLPEFVLRLPALLWRKTSSPQQCVKSSRR